MPPRRWTVALGWMGVILALSTETFSFRTTLSLVEAVLVRVMPAEAATDAARMNAQARTGAHVLEYAVLAMLLVRALTTGRRGGGRGAGRAVAIALAVCIAWAVVDEGLQARAPARRGTVTDVALDAAGGVLGIAVWIAVTRRRATRDPDTAWRRAPGA